MSTRDRERDRAKFLCAYCTEQLYPDRLHVCLASRRGSLQCNKCKSLHPVWMQHNCIERAHGSKPVDEDEQVIDDDVEAQVSLSEQDMAAHIAAGMR